MPKFFVEENQVEFDENRIVIVGEDVNHIKNVLRMSIGEDIKITVKSSNPKTYKAIINKLSDNIECSIIKEIHNNTEANINITIFQGIPKSDKMEMIIQKCTELGVKRFIPLELKRCIAKLEGKDIQKKIVRWQKIAEVAAKQSGREEIPEVLEKVDIKAFCKNYNEYDLVLVAYEQEKNNNIQNILKLNKNAKNIAIVIGPEGGFDEEEIKILRSIR